MPNKMKHFAWRACNDGLPTMDYLLRCHIAHSALCNNCHTQNEDPLHAIWGCSKLESVRDSATFNPSTFPPPADFTDLLARFLQVQEDDIAELLICIASFLWNRRNALRLGKPTHPLHLVNALAGRFLQEIQSAQEWCPRIAQVSTHDHWCPPDDQVFKANFDGATFNSISAASLGVVIRDSHGEVIGNLSLQVPLPLLLSRLKPLPVVELSSSQWKLVFMMSYLKGIVRL